MTQKFNYKGQEIELPDANTWKHGNRMEYAIWPAAQLMEAPIDTHPSMSVCERLLFEMAHHKDGHNEWILFNG